MPVAPLPEVRVKRRGGGAILYSSPLLSHLPPRHTVRRKNPHRRHELDPPFDAILTTHTFDAGAGRAEGRATAPDRRSPADAPDRGAVTTRIHPAPGTCSRRTGSVSTSMARRHYRTACSCPRATS